LQADPASIAFAQLAEEFRRAGRLDDAVRICRIGLTRHPSYPSARVTLGRALLAQGRHDEARAEFEAAPAGDPDNCTATRALEELGAGTSRLPRAAGDAVPQRSPGWPQRAIEELEGWLASVRADRAARQRDSARPSAPEY
jgi:tetratricopeptide (TPR) repeat protein